MASWAPPIICCFILSALVIGLFLMYTGPPRGFVRPGAKYRFEALDDNIYVIRSCLRVNFLL